MTDDDMLANLDEKAPQPAAAKPEPAKQPESGKAVPAAPAKI
jgi:hypothetical protein